MAGQIIARGEVVNGKVLPFDLLMDDGRRRSLGAWAVDYLGRTLTISLEEKEEEPALTHNLAVALAGA